MTVASAALAAGGEPAPGQAVLSAESYWRCHYTWSGALVRKGAVVEPWGESLQTPPPPAGWTAPDFDDGGWVRSPGPFHPQSQGYWRGTPRLALIGLRGKFTVDDPARAGPLTLSAGFRGGLVVHLNGKEVHRAHLPAGKVEPNSLAEDYSAEVYASQGKSPQCLRKVESVALPADALRKGVNVLAVEIHRTAVPESWTRGRGWEASWATAHLDSLELKAPAGAAVRPNLGRPKGLQVWNARHLEAVHSPDYGDPGEPLRPMRIVATRNGAFSGQVVVGSDGPIRGLQAALSELKPSGGGAGLPASAGLVRYALADSPETQFAYRTIPGWEVRRADVLLEAPPAEVAVARFKDAARSGALVAVWVTVEVPADAAGGEYAGKLTVSAQNLAPVDVPVSLEVCGWKLPDPRERDFYAGVIQSPESVAMRYGVELWSDRHFQLMDRSFRFLGQLGNKCVYIPMISHTQFGNAETMVRYERQADGSCRPDFSIMDRYLDLYEKRVGKPDAVCLHLWDIFCGSQGNVWTKDVMAAKPVPVTVLAGGKAGSWNAPAYGTPEGETFWKPVLDAARERLKKRGLSDENILFGLATDLRPNKQCAEFFKKIAPWGSWALHSHEYADNIHGVPVRYVMQVHGVGPAPDPAKKRFYGWKAPNRDTIYPRTGCIACTLESAQPLAAYYALSELALICNVRGFGSLGADFWADPKTGHRLPESFPESRSPPGFGNAMAATAILAPGPEGAVATVRFEALREGVQEAEARVFLEKTLTDPALKARLGGNPGQRIQDALDERARRFFTASQSGWADLPEWASYAGSGWEERRKALFTLAAEVSKLLGSK